MYILYLYFILIFFKVNPEVNPVENDIDDTCISESNNQSELILNTTVERSPPTLTPIDSSGNFVFIMIIMY